MRYKEDMKDKLKVIGIVAAILLVFGVLFALTTPSSKSKIKSKNTVAKQSTPSTILSPAPTTALPAPKGPLRACEALVGNIVDLNYKHPTLNPAVINSLAVPNLAKAILAAPHMTPGEIAQQEVLNPRITGNDMGTPSHPEGVTNPLKGQSDITVGSPVNLSMFCYTQRTSSGNYIVTKLVKD